MLGGVEEAKFSRRSSPSRNRGHLWRGGVMPATTGNDQDARVVQTRKATAVCRHETGGWVRFVSPGPSHRSASGNLALLTLPPA